MTDTVVKSEQIGETYDPEKKRHGEMSRAPVGSSNVSASASEDSLLAAADYLIHDIDGTIRPTARKDEVGYAIGPAAHKGELVNAIGPAAHKGELDTAATPAARKGEADNAIGPAARKGVVDIATRSAAHKGEVVKALGPAVRKRELDDAARPAVHKGEVSCNAKLITTVNLNFFPGEQNQRLDAFDGTGRVNLDAVEKWASTSKLDINLNKKKKENANSVAYKDENQIVQNKLQKADTAVAEINAIVETVPVNERSKQAIFKIQSSSATKNIKAPSPVLSLATNQFNSDLPAILPTTPHAKPLQSIRLPPVRTATLPSEDIFHRKLEDITLLHIPHRLPKLEPHKAISKEKSFADIKEEEVKCSNKAKSPDQAAKASMQYLLPGQVQEKSSEEELNGVVEVRTIVLDYSSTKKVSTQVKQETRCGLTKFCTSLCCCRRNTYEADDLEEGNMDTENETKKRSLPRRIWKRIKKCFGI